MRLPTLFYGNCLNAFQIVYDRFKMVLIVPIYGAEGVFNDEYVSVNQTQKRLHPLQ